MGPIVDEALIASGKHYRSRYLLPMEMLLYIVMIVVALHGFLLEQIVAHSNNVSWILGLGLVGGVGFHVSAIEWCNGYDWQGERLRKWVYLRKWLSIIAIAVWFYVLDALLKFEEGGRLNTLLLGVLALLPFHAWSWWINFRTWVVLHPNFSTRKLEASLETARHRW